MEFEWDEAKRERNLVKHKIDFVRAKEIWLDRVIDLPSDQDYHGEKRWVAIGQCGEKLITVIYTYRGENIRIISARIARDYEREYYNDETR